MLTSYQLLVRIGEAHFLFAPRRVGIRNSPETYLVLAFTPV